MPKLSMHVQCILSKGATKQTTWLPKRYARLGQYVELKEAGGWENGWRVVETGTELPTEVVMERGQDYKRTRKASDV